ncbi:hypothetical protein ACSQ67_020985 [Phaseolus vulgaris]
MASTSFIASFREHQSGNVVRSLQGSEAGRPRPFPPSFRYLPCLRPSYYSSLLRALNTFCDPNSFLTRSIFLSPSLRAFTQTLWTSFPNPGNLLASTSSSTQEDPANYQCQRKPKSLEEDQLVKQASEVGPTISKLRGWKGSTNKESHKVVELSQQVGGLPQETVKLRKELRRSRQEAKALPIEKSNEVLKLSNKNVELQADVERFKEELAKRGEEMVQKDEKLEKVKEALTDDAANSYPTSFEDVLTQALGIYPEMDFSQLGFEKTVVDRRLVDEEEYYLESSRTQLPFAAF